MAAGEKKLWVRHIALPTDHGSWVFLLSPLVIGLFAGGALRPASLFLVLASLAAFLVRQPVTIVVKAYSGRRRKDEAEIAYYWIALYAVLGLAGVIGMLLSGSGFVILLSLPALPVLAWHLWLVSRREERHAIGIEVVAAGTLALAAPAAYWAGLGFYAPFGWWLWGLCWLQSAASIVYAYLRLAQRRLEAVPPRVERLHMARRALLYTTFNLLLAVVLSALHIFPPWMPLAFSVQWLETLWGTEHPAVGAKPTAIGMRQLAVSVIFTLVFILTAV